jgi:quercetin dioxygenase-like cupin family protein
MEPHKRITDRLRNQATEFVFRDLSHEEYREHARHLDVCEVCRNEVAGQRALAEEIGFVPPPKEGRPAETPADTSRGLAHPIMVRRDPRGFEPSGFPGVFVRRLHVDADNDRVTMLVRMEPGTSYPAHRHSGLEECFVLEGDLEVGPTTLWAGDYQRAEKGSRHPVQGTRSGCLLYVTSSLHDEIQDKER